MRTVTWGWILAAALVATAARGDEFKCPEGARDSGARKGQPRWCEMQVSGRLVYHGPSWRFHADGTVASKETYDRGSATGDAETWHQNGKRASKGTYRDGEAVGTWRTWDQAGRLRSETLFALPRATRTEFFPSGPRRASGPLLDGAKVGTWTLWSEDGKEKGRCDLGEGVIALPPARACLEVAETVDPKGFGRPVPRAEVAADGGFTLGVGGEVYAFTPPEGWQADARAGAADRLPVVLYPRSAGAGKGTSMMYVRPLYRDGKSFAEAVASERDTFKGAVVDYAEKGLEEGKTGLGRPFTSKTVTYRATRPASAGAHIISDHPAHEALAFVDASDRVILAAVLASDDEIKLAEARPALLQLARSVRKGGGK